MHEGTTYQVDRPELIALPTVADRFSASDQGLFRWLRVEDCLRLQNAEREEATARAA